MERRIQEEKALKIIKKSIEQAQTGKKGTSKKPKEESCKKDHWERHNRKKDRVHTNQENGKEER